MEENHAGNSRDDAEASTSEAGPFAYSNVIEHDLLRNTPSNIARLEDVIEQCQARQKYRARTKSPSDGEDIRWYFCKVPLAPKELAASVPRTEIVGKSEYFRFSMRDSLALEAFFLQREEELLTCWWKEYAECSEGPTVAEISHSDDFDSVEEERVGVPVKGGLYEVDLTRRHCFPVYWHGENRRILRGHWFARKGGVDWIPLREDIAEQLELAYHCQVWHRRKFQPSGLFAARVDIHGNSQGLHALFTGEDDNWDAWLVLGVIPKLGGGNSVKLRRGFSHSGSLKTSQDELRQQKEEQMDDYCSQVPVGHLVFMIHGIGQRLEKANLIDDVGTFRRVTASLEERYLTPYQRSTQRILFIPCQWRKGLKLSSENAVEKITLDAVRGLRVALSATVHDVLYYMSPMHCQSIIDSVSNQLNRLYMKFLKRNPGYSGKVSLYGHSLGSVLSYDILCHQNSLFQPFRLDQMNVEALPNTVKTSTEDQTQLIPTTDQRPCSVLHEVDKSENVKSLFSPGYMNDAAVPAESSLPQRDGLASPEQAQENESANATEEVLDKDKAILLEEETFSKGRITQLENSVQSPFTTECGDNAALYKGEISESTFKLSSIEKLPTLQADTGKSYMPIIRYHKLNFKVDTFFAVGSPLGLFLALRNVRIGAGRGQDYWQDENIIEEMPACQLMFNIFHPFDPVAYRVEPLVCKEFISRRPVIIPYHRGGKRLHIGVQQLKEDIVACSRGMVSHFDAVRIRALQVLQVSNKDKTQENVENTEEESRSYGSIMMEQLTGSEAGRIDHALQEQTFQHPLLLALGSHTNYWRDHDTALFILKHLYRDIPEDPPSEDDSSKVHRRPIKLFYERDPLNEDISLTFSDDALIKEFSRKCRKVTKAI